MSVVSRSESAWARSVSSGIPVITPPVTSLRGRCSPASSPHWAASSSSCRRSASSLSSGASSGRLRTAIDKPPFQTDFPARRRLDSSDTTHTPTCVLGSRTICRLMPSPLPSPVRRYAAFLLLVVLAGCQPGSNPRPVPSVAQIGSNLKCPSGDRGFEDPQAGWGFFYPGGWGYNERAQGSQNPPGLDLAFDITYAPASPAPCPSPSPLASGESPHPNPTPCAGDFAFMIISTYERGTSSDLVSWIAANLTPPSPSPSA